MVAKEQWMAPRQENGCIHSVNKYFLSICYMPGTMLAAACRDRQMRRRSFTKEVVPELGQQPSVDGTKDNNNNKDN